MAKEEWHKFKITHYLKCGKGNMLYVSLKRQIWCLNIYVLPRIGNIFIANIGLLGTLLALLSAAHFLTCKPKMWEKMIEICSFFANM